MWCEYVTLSDLTLLWALLGSIPLAYEETEDLDNTQLVWNHRAENGTQASDSRVLMLSHAYTMALVREAVLWSSGTLIGGIAPMGR